MNKLIKHEFRATARIVLPFLAVVVASSLIFAVMNRITHVSGALMALVAMICFLSFVALGFLGLIIIISRFYRNTMTDNAYLTMTLPLNAHEFIWGELIMCLLWTIIVTAVLFATFLGSLGLMSMITPPKNPVAVRNVIALIGKAFKEHGMTIFMALIIGLEGLTALVLAFFEFCLRIYACMSIGQLFSKCRGLFSVIAYILIGLIAAVVFVLLINIFGKTLMLDAKTLEHAALTFGIFDLILAVIDALLYLPTSFLIGRKLNLA